MLTFSYGSGKLIGRPEVAAVFANVADPGLTNWVDTYQPPLTVSDVCRMTGFLRDLVDSAYMDLIGQEYSTGGVFIGRGTFRGSFFAPVAAGRRTADGLTEVADADIRGMLAAEIASGALPAVSGSACYLVFLPVSTVSVSPFGRSDSPGARVAGYHSAFTLASGPPVYYAVIAYDATGSAFTVSHELAEMVTNPEGNGWTAPRQTPSAIVLEEIADICDEPAFFHGEAVSQVWSRSLGRCHAPADDGPRKRFARATIVGGTCLGHAVEGAPLNLTLQVDFTEAAQQQPFPFYVWFATGGTASGSNTQPQFAVVPPAAPDVIQVSVTARDQLGCAYTVSREFRVVTANQAAREARFCALIARLRTTATIVFRPNPLWDPVRDFVTRPVSPSDIEAIERAAGDLAALAQLLREHHAAERSGPRTPSR